jgi:hypothetical protein
MGGQITPAKASSNLRFYRTSALENCDIDADTRPLEGRSIHEMRRNHIVLKSIEHSIHDIFAERAQKGAGPTGCAVNADTPRRCKKLAVRPKDGWALYTMKNLQLT